ncbi:MAG: hypothetical protein ACTHK7_03260, partial [Aureliella sp.]
CIQLCRRNVDRRLTEPPMGFETIVEKMSSFCLTPRFGIVSSACIVRDASRRDELARVNFQRWLLNSSFSSLLPAVGFAVYLLCRIFWSSLKLSPLRERSSAGKAFGLRKAPLAKRSFSMDLRCWFRSDL